MVSQLTEARGRHDQVRSVKLGVACYEVVRAVVTCGATKRARVYI